jgi:cobalt transporter subunit CbtA
MIRKVLASALVSGLLAAVLVTVIQEFTTTPIILHAEEYEGGGDGEDHAFLNDLYEGGSFILAHGDVDHDDGAWAPENGLERTFYTFVANLVAGVGFALLLVAGFVLHGKPIDARRGVIWGLAGFATFAIAPSLGLPPEVPGSMAAELGARQMWWLATVIATGVGLWCLVFATPLWLKALGVLAIVLPHAFGAPQPDHMGGPVPPELAGHFVAASLATAFIFWAALGWLAGRTYERFTGNPA